MKIPKDIKLESVKFIIRQFFICAIPTAATVLFIVFFGDRTFGQQGQPMITAYILFVPLVLFLSGFPKRFIDSTWKGKITDIKVETTEARRGKGQWGLPSLYQRTVITIIVETEKGKTVKFNVFDGEAAPSTVETVTGRYHVGAEVLHVYGTKFVQVTSEKADDKVVCVVCGEENEQDAEKCDRCKHSLKIVTEDL